jgi:crotonobetainyl-CoA:carnitine CoA-transferase CaiB-like acyl-CoA transferase
MLADMGAEVIKVEEPGRGDPSRDQSRFFGGSLQLAGGRDYPFETANRNKRSITLDLKHPKGKEVFFKLIEDADIFYTNWRLPLLRRMGVDYEVMKQHNPRIVYARTTALGSLGPEGHRRGFDPMGMARSGMMWAVGDREQEEPFQIVGGIFDQMAAAELAYGVLAALLTRERQGFGQELEVSILGSAVHLQAVMVNARTLTGRAIARHSRKRARNVMSNHYRCRDGRWIMLLEPQSDRFWEEFCRVTCRPELVTDPRFNTALKRRETYAQLIPILEETFLTRNRDEWLHLFDENRCEFAYCGISDYDDLVTDKQVLANDYLVEFDHPVLGKTKMVGFPVKFSRTPCAIQREAPELGQHTEEVLQGMGYTQEKIVELKQMRVI